MSHPQPDDAILREWQAIVETLLENLPVDVALLRRADGGSLEIAAAAPDTPSYSVGDRAPRDGGHFCDVILEDNEMLDVINSADDNRWQETSESRDGYANYIGALLHWPDGDAYGTLAVMNSNVLSKTDADRARRLLQRLVVGANAQLGMLVRRKEGHYEATHDALTGLPNRQLFNDLASMQMKVAARNGAALWVVLWSIDEFREMAESQGRENLTVMLAKVSERARSCIRQSDVLARIGDNQFAFMLAGANEFVANAVADRLRRNLASLKPSSEQGAKHVTSSCGMTPYHDKESLDDWLARARTAMDDAKSAGGNSVMVLEADR